VSGAPGAVTVTGLNGRTLGSLTPLDGQYLKWNAGTQQWEPTTLAGALSVFGRTGTIAAQTGDYSFGQVLAWDGAQWAPQAFAGGGGVTSVFGRSAVVTAQTGDYSFAQISGTVGS